MSFLSLERPEVHAGMWQKLKDGKGKAEQQNGRQREGKQGRKSFKHQKDRGKGENENKKNIQNSGTAV